MPHKTEQVRLFTVFTKNKSLSQLAPRLAQRLLRVNGARGSCSAQQRNSSISDKAHVQHGEVVPCNGRALLPVGVFHLPPSHWTLMRTVPVPAQCRGPHEMLSAHSKAQPSLAQPVSRSRHGEISFPAVLQYLTEARRVRRRCVSFVVTYHRTYTEIRDTGTIQ